MQRSLQRAAAPAPRRRRGAATLWLAALCSAAPTLAQDPASDAPSEVELTDAEVGDGPLAFGDATAFRAAVTGGEVDCTLTMARPFVAGMFTMCELWIDCDDKPATGLEGGHELRIRAAVGSRFEPNAAGQGAGDRRPALGHLRQSMTVLEDDGSSGRRWIHTGQRALPRPEVDGNQLRWRFPVSLVKERGDRYQSAFTMHVFVQTSCSDQPIEVAHVCGDQGIAIEVDGDDGEWSDNGITDPGDELHEAARPLDMTMLRVEHSETELFASVRFATAGFGDPLESHDVDCIRALSLRIEPQFPRYQKPAVVGVRAGDSSRDGYEGGQSWRSVVRGDRLEFAIGRASSQAKFRVLATTDHVCVDRFERAARLDWAKSR